MVVVVSQLWLYATQFCCGYTFAYPRLGEEGVVATATVTTILRHTILLRVYFCPPTNVDISADVVFNVHTSQVM